VSARYNVIFRTCDAVTAVRGSRPFGLDKRSIIKTCFFSLFESVKPFPHTIHILGDRLSPEILAFFKRFADKNPGISISNNRYGNDESIQRSLSLAVSFPDDEWVYFCEDDYLHMPQAFLWIDELIQNRSEVLRWQPGRRLMRFFFHEIHRKPLFIHPADYPDRYDARRRQFGLLFLTKYNHWRQISDTTFTFLAEVKSLKAYERHIRKSADGARDDYLSRHLYGHVFFRGRGLCLSPIPGLATHMTEGVMTPLVDWHALQSHLADKVEAFEKSPTDSQRDIQGNG
jgi:hypothetical protein